MAVFNVIVKEARLDNARPQVKAVWHDSCTENTTCLIESEVRVRYGRRTS